MAVSSTNPGRGALAHSAADSPVTAARCMSIVYSHCSVITSANLHACGRHGGIREVDTGLCRLSPPDG